MANGDQAQVSSFLILRTFRTVKPEKMAVFMNAITWQAAWLRHHFQWIRMLVGYALTDVPERVLEIYGIPMNDSKRAQRILEKMRAQDEYQELLECVEPQENEEVLLPAMQYKTFLGSFMEQHMKQLGIGKLRRQLVRERAANRRQLAELNALESKRADARVRLDGARVRLDGAKGRLGGVQKVLAPAPGGLAELHGTKANDAGVSGSKFEAIRLPEEEEVASIEKEVDLIDKSIARLPVRAALNAKENEVTKQLSQVEKDLRKAQDELERELERIPIPDYFLNVTIKLKPDPETLPKYVEEMTKLLDEFSWDFMAAGERLPLRQFKGPPPEHEIMHIWRFGDANDLYRQMVGLRESRGYAAIRLLLAEPEKQMLMCDWEAISRTKRTPFFHGEGKEA